MPARDKRRAPVAATGLSETQLRRSAVDVNLGATVSHVIVDNIADTPAPTLGDISINALTNTELRAAPVAATGAFVVDAMKPSGIITDTPTVALAAWDDVNSTWRPLPIDGTGTRLKAVLANDAGFEVGLLDTAPGAADLGLVVRNIPSGTQAVSVGRPAAANRTSVPAAAVDTQLLAANAARFGAAVYNDADKTLYLALGSVAASLSSYTCPVLPGGYFETPFAYPGAIRGIWAAAPTGAARVTEVV